jgi:hypothetical protein
VTLRHLGLGYLGVGVTLAVWLWSRERKLREPLPALGSALLAVPLWPLWVPVAVWNEAPAGGDLGERVRAACMTLRQAAEACAEAGLERLLSRGAAEALAEGLARAWSRVVELDRLAASAPFDAERARARLDRHEAEGATRAAALARAQLDHATRLARSREKEARALEELVELVHALRAQVLLAPLAVREAPGEAEALSDEIRSRVEALAAALGPEDAAA